MPTYDYRCQVCGHTFEAVQSMMDAPLTHCEVCKGEVKRLIGGGIGIQFKGSGFYVTDSKATGSVGQKSEPAPPSSSPSSSS